MSPSKIVLLGSLIFSLPLFGQQAPTGFSVTKIDVAFQATPDFGVPGYGKRVRRAGTWLEIEATFDWTPLKADEKFLEELTVNYFVLLKLPTAESTRGTLLSGSSVHHLVSAGRDKKSVVYVAPRVLEKLFDGRVPSTVNAMVAGVGVELVVGGQVVAEQTTQGRGAWWRDEGFKPITGLVLDKAKTPFAHLAWDYHEPLKFQGSN